MPLDARSLLLLAAGGTAGTLARAGVSAWAAGRWGPFFPWGTLIVNVAGCFLIGVLGTLCQRGTLGPEVKTAAVTGMLGAFTTFSAFSFETWGLVQAGQWAAALGNLGLSLAAGFAALAAGVGIARALA